MPGVTDQSPKDPAAEVLSELKRLRGTSDEILKRYLETLRRIHELEGKLEARPDGLLFSRTRP